MKCLNKCTKRIMMIALAAAVEAGPVMLAMGTVNVYAATQDNAEELVPGSDDSYEVVAGNDGAEAPVPEGDTDEEVLTGNDSSEDPGFDDEILRGRLDNGEDVLLEGDKALSFKSSEAAAAFNNEAASLPEKKDHRTIGDRYTKVFIPPQQRKNFRNGIKTRLTYTRQKTADIFTFRIMTNQ